MLKMWEALYRVFIDVYFDEHENSEVAEEVLRLIKTSTEPAQLLGRATRITEKQAIEFFGFINDKRAKDTTWKFWIDFAFKNCFSYISLFLSVCGSNWNLCVASLKEMTPLFAAFDQDTYQKDNSESPC